MSGASGSHSNIPPTMVDVSNTMKIVIESFNEDLNHSFLGTSDIYRWADGKPLIFGYWEKQALKIIFAAMRTHFIRKTTMKREKKASKSLPISKIISAGGEKYGNIVKFGRDPFEFRISTKECARHLAFYKTKDGSKFKTTTINAVLSVITDLKIGISGGSNYFEQFAIHDDDERTIKMNENIVNLVQTKVITVQMQPILGGLAKMGVSVGGHCAECDEKPAKWRCAECNKTGQMLFYCSRECQCANWPHHKNFCSIPIPVKKLTGPSSTDQKSVYGILLPQNDAKPVVVEVNINGDYSKFLGKGHYTMRYYYGNPCKKRPYEDTLIILFRANFLRDGSKSKPNKCIQTITGGKAPEPWNGPVLVIKVKGQMTHHVEWLDLYPNEGEYIIDFFMLYGCEEKV